jgi:hypothetical protein
MAAGGVQVPPASAPGAAALRHDAGKPDAGDPEERASSRPGFQVELHIYANVGHGFGLRPERAGQSQQEWTTQLVAFLRQARLIAPAAR